MTWLSGLTQGSGQEKAEQVRAKAAEAGSSISESLHQFGFIAKEMSEGVRTQAKYYWGSCRRRRFFCPRRGGHGGCWRPAGWRRSGEEDLQALVATGTP